MCGPFHTIYRNCAPNHLLQVHRKITHFPQFLINTVLCLKFLHFTGTINWDIFPFHSTKSSINFWPLGLLMESWQGHSSLPSQKTYLWFLYALPKSMSLIQCNKRHTGLNDFTGLYIMARSNFDIFFKPFCINSIPIHQQRVTKASAVGTTALCITCSYLLLEQSASSCQTKQCVLHSDICPEWLWWWVGGAT